MWQQFLQGRLVDKVSLLEPACGSANDYRFLHQFGLAEFLHYTDIDIAPKNIDNAKQRFPETNFHTQSIIDADFDDNAFDYLYVHDLFEHLSLEALDQTLTQVLRITKHQSWLHFFNVNDQPDHTEKPTDKYHWNTLSLQKLINTLQHHGAEVKVIHIPELLQKQNSTSPPTTTPAPTPSSLPNPPPNNPNAPTIYPTRLYMLNSRAIWDVRRRSASPRTGTEPNRH